MGNTANNNWPYPESTDLVKDGATAIENLADAIDTTLGVYTPSSSGLTLINTTSFSAVSSQTFTGLTSTYNHFRIIIKLSAASVVVSEMRLRMSLSGTPATGSDYTFRGAEYTSSVVLNTGSNVAYFTLGYHSNNAPANTGIVLDLIALSQATRTNVHSSTMGFDNIQQRATTTHGVHNLATAYNEVVLLSDTGTFTGEASIFGYAK
jgi:hypothetical protein